MLWHVLSLALLLLWSQGTNASAAQSSFPSSSSSTKGAVVGLLKGSQKSDFDQLILRNKSLLKFMWVNETGANNPDVVLFFEDGFSKELQSYIQDQTPELAIKFVPIQFGGHGIFEDATNTTAKLVNPICPPTFWSNQFNIGYRNMCRFWFLGVFDYLTAYDWMFRLDCDCELLDYITHLMPDNVIGGAGRGAHHHHAFVSSPGWQPLHRQKYDKVATTRDGEVVTGLGAFTRAFADRHGLNHSFIDSMYAPYTNAMYINLRWLWHSAGGLHRQHQISLESAIPTAASAGSVHATLSTAQGHGQTQGHGAKHQAALIRQFMKEVDESNCIYSNRWGDMPLWGAALALVEHTVHFLNVPYYHLSHNVIIKGDSRTGYFRGDIPHMLIYADNQNSTLNTRISVNGR